MRDTILDEVVGDDGELDALPLDVAVAVAAGQEADGVRGEVELGARADEVATDALLVALPLEHVGDAAAELLCKRDV